MCFLRFVSKSQPQTTQSGIEPSAPWPCPETLPLSYGSLPEIWSSQKSIRLNQNTINMKKTLQKVVALLSVNWGPFKDFLKIYLLINFPSLSTRPPGVESNLILIGLIRKLCLWAISRSELRSLQNLCNRIIWIQRQQKVVTSSEWCRLTRSFYSFDILLNQWNGLLQSFFNFFALQINVIQVSAPRPPGIRPFKLSGLVSTHCHWATGDSRAESSQIKTLPIDQYFNDMWRHPL